MPVREVKLHYIALFKEGLAFGDAGVLRVRDYDRTNLDLVGVTMEDGAVMLHAERGELIVDVDRDTIAVRLIGVTMADGGTGGGVFEQPILEPTGAVALEFDAVP